MITPQELLSLGFQFNTGDETHSISITNKLHLEVEDGKVFIVMINPGQGEVIWEELPNVNTLNSLKVLVFHLGGQE